MEQKLSERRELRERLEVGENERESARRGPEGEPVASSSQTFPGDGSMLFLGAKPLGTANLKYVKIFCYFLRFSDKRYVHTKMNTG